MNPVDFEVKTDIAKIGGTKIEANYDAVKEYIQEAMQPYKSMVVSVDNVPEAKKDRANVRKVRDRIDEYRKTIKNQWSAPLKEFEARCKELTDICDAAAKNIDRQIKGFEEQSKSEKYEHLKAFFERVSKREGVSEYLTFESIYNTRWQNATYPVENAESDIVWAINIFSQDMNTIKNLGSKHEAELLSTYIATHNMSDVVKKQHELEQLASLINPSNFAQNKQSGRGKKTYTLTLKMSKKQANGLFAFIQDNEIEIVEEK